MHKWERKELRAKVNVDLGAKSSQMLDGEWRRQKNTHIK